MLVSACGFEPLYVEKKSSGQWYYDNKFDTGIKEEMASVKVELIQDRIGQLIRNDLLDKLSPKGEPKHAKYILSVTSINKQEIDQALRNDITATRKKVIYKVTYVLRNPERKTLINSTSVAYTGYDILRDRIQQLLPKRKLKKMPQKS